MMERRRNVLKPKVTTEGNNFSWNRVKPFVRETNQSKPKSLKRWKLNLLTEQVNFVKWECTKLIFAKWVTTFVHDGKLSFGNELRTMN
ncbi:MAG: hypothetical protein ACTS43_02080 [Candidatus Hodgkinia cicadicola]